MTPQNLDRTWIRATQSARRDSSLRTFDLAVVGVSGASFAVPRVAPRPTMVEPHSNHQTNQKEQS
jgi:hypothetical protein